MMERRSRSERMMDAPDLSRLQLEVVTYERDRQQIFESMLSRPLVVSAFTNDRVHLRFEVQKIERSQLYLVLQQPYDRRPTPSEAVTLTFGLDEGQYFVRATLQAVAGDLYAIPIGEKLYRLQRRSNFRAPIPENMHAVYHLKKKDPNSPQVTLVLTDISGGGLGLLVPKGRSLPAGPGDEVSGMLEITGREPLKLEGVIRHLWPPDAEGCVKVGLQCKGMGPAEERELMAICMQIHRELISVFRSFNR